MEIHPFDNLDALINQSEKVEIIVLFRKKDEFFLNELFYTAESLRIVKIYLIPVRF